MEPVSSPKQVLVIGGGPGGMEAARVAATRGHQVTLIEKTDRLGGQLNIATVPPGKDEMQRITDYLIREMDRLAVTLKLNTIATPALISELAPDQVIVATGATPSYPEFPGSDLKHVVSAWDVLAGTAETGAQVVVKGGGMVGLETALYLAEQDKSVVLVTGRERIGEDESPTVMPMVNAKIARYNIKILTGHSLVCVNTGEVEVKDAEGESSIIAADTVVMAQRATPETALAKSLAEKWVDHCCIGDCAENRPRTLGDAIFEGFEAAVRL